jgi:disulfide bond formation protein DsbB
LIGATRLFAAIAALCFGAVALALFTQHALGMQPCPWCVLQRLIFVLIGIVAGVGAIWHARAPRVGAAFLADLLASAGIAAAVWHNLGAKSAASCNLTLADRIISGSGLDVSLPEVFEPRASCADASLLLGLPYELWSLAAFVIAGLLASLALRAVLRPAP